MLGTRRWILQNNPLDLIERGLVIAAIVELGGSRALMRPSAGRIQAGRR
jgi:hypothetical protein